MSLPTVGLILMIVGIVGLVISLFFMFVWSPWRGAGVRRHVIDERDGYYDDPTRPSTY